MCLIQIGPNLFSLLLNTIAVVTDVNLAYGRPASMSSTVSYYGLLYASFAVDGFYDSQYTHYHCAATNDPSGGPNWLSVDLGRLVQVDYVALTNRGDGGWGELIKKKFRFSTIL